MLPNTMGLHSDRKTRTKWSRSEDVPSRKRDFPVAPPRAHLPCSVRATFLATEPGLLHVVSLSTHASPRRASEWVHWSPPSRCFLLTHFPLACSNNRDILQVPCDLSEILLSMCRGIDAKKPTFEGVHPWSYYVLSFTEYQSTLRLNT